MKISARLLALIFFTTSGISSATAQSTSNVPKTSFLGFDRNDYPGDQNLVTLRQTFSFAGYWLNNPPGAKAGFQAGIYCSGIAAKEDNGTSVITANDIRQTAGARKIVYWVANDACPPSPGCVFSKDALPKPAQSGIDVAEVWQFAQSPKRKDVAAGCPNYSADGSCYPPGISPDRRLHLDVNVATSMDPSHGRPIHRQRNTSSRH